MGMLQEVRLHPKRGLKFAALMPSLVAGGMSMAIIGPTLLDLQDQVSCTTSQVALIFTARAAGSIVGCFICGLLGSRFNLLLTTVIASLVGAATTAAFGFVTDLKILIAVSVVYGIHYGYAKGVRMALIMQLWGRECSPFQQLQGFLFGLGQLLAPLIVAPFLVNSDPLREKEHLTTDSRVQTRLFIPYSMVAGLMLVNAVIMLAAWIYDPDSSDHPSRINAASESGNQTESRIVAHKAWVYLVVVLMAIGLHINSGVELNLGQFLVTYGFKSRLHLPKTTGVLRAPNESQKRNP